MRAILSQAITIGPITVPGWLVLYFFALSVSATAGRLLRAVDSDGRRRTADIVLNVGTIWLLAWKLTPVLLRPAVTVRDPLAVLSAPGGTAGVLVGIGLSLAYLVAVVLRDPPSPRLYVQLGASVVSAAIAFFVGMAVMGIVLTSSATDRVAPAFTLESLDGKEVSLETFRGRTVLLNFWATWCPPCRGEIPDLIAFHRKADDTDVVLLSINQAFTEPSRAAIREFAAELEVNYPILLDETGLASSLYGVRGIPTTFVIGPDGRILEQAFGAVSRSWLSRFLP